ncbi:hypothetical protein [Paraflavitalea sp. CAU 1676]|uniref:hypothetical protein n=1 Tax=Paraflavitalea sp. CAU 1676 TaxID=3032598 RepID=UPI0023DA0BC6|nr:hypothetical protein [Paraflavitalea sp. CAU 1676]MDF2192376.1 hypothetical protein [Paraflavitalea sp. CAU 1676]
MSKMLSLVLLGSLLVTACRKPGNEPQKDEIPSDIVVTGQGDPTGPLVSASIGVQGGELTTADGKLKIIVPAGAVTANQTFSIQPVENTFRQGKNFRNAFRLLPAVTTFSRPVIVVMQYDPAEITSGAEDILQVAYQDETGGWKAVPSALDKRAHTLTVQATHFSDYVYYEQFELFSNKDVVFAGEKVKFKLGLQVALSSSHNDMLEPMETYITSEFDRGKENTYSPVLGGYVTTVKDWKVVTGGGTVLGMKNGNKFDSEAEYTAPTEVTAAREVVIEVTLEGAEPIADPSAPGGKRKPGPLVLRKTMKLVPETYAVLTFKGQDYLFTDGLTVATHFGQTTIFAASSELHMDIDFTVGAQAAGVYPCGQAESGNGKATVLFSYVSGGTYIEANSTYCELQSGVAVAKYSSSSVHITRFAAPGEIVEGKWAGTLYQEKPNTTGCKFDPITVGVQFRIRRQS